MWTGGALCPLSRYFYRAESCVLRGLTPPFALLLIKVHFDTFYSSLNAFTCSHASVRSTHWAVTLESRTFLLDFPLDFPPELDEKSCVNRSWTDERSFINLKLDRWKNFLLTRSLIDDKILVYVVKMQCTLYSNDINQNPGPNVWWNTFFV